MPFKLVPSAFNGAVLARVLNHTLKEQLREGELDFLEGYSVCLEARDLKTAVAVRLSNGRFVGRRAREQQDLRIDGTLYDFMLLATGREDPDTLFFQRHLRMTGSTMLGVHLKNFIASVDPRELPVPSALLTLMERSVTLAERMSGTRKSSA